MKPIQKTVLITGASAGIGHALAIKLLEHDYKVIGTSRDGNIAGIANTNFITIPLELTETASVNQGRQWLAENDYRIDILINNAGVAPDINTNQPDMESLRATFDSNVFGLVAFTEAILPLINVHGQVLNISSQMGILNRPPAADSTAYRMSKTALNMYTRTLAARLKPKNIAVTSIHPGWVQTKLSSKGAPLTTQESAAGIFHLLNFKMKTGSFWSAESLEELPW